MAESILEADYLVVGAGAAAMAFVDTLLSETTDATVLMVDREHRPGGHWNHAYPFVRLHQPAAFYGVASRELGSGRKDSTGFNAGSYTLASGPEVLAYFDAVMNERFLPSGRVRWLPMSEHRPGADGTQVVRSLTSGTERRVRARKVVDVTHARTEVPATHPPRYRVAPGVRCIPPNDLPKVRQAPSGYTVVGGGKTGVDTCVWLLENAVPPSRIRWIVPRDAWFIDRSKSQPGLENFETNMRTAIAQFESIAEAASLPDLFARLEQRGVLLRLDPRVEPTCYHCAIVSPGELAALRRIEDVVRLGRVQALDPDRIVLEHGTLPVEPDTVHVDCSASGIQRPPRVPVFDGDLIHVLMLRWCQPVFSAALIAWVEAHVDDAAGKNALCSVVPSPFEPIDWLRMWGVTLANMGRWRQHEALSAWLAQCRLNSNAVIMRGVRADDAARMALVKQSGAKAMAAAERIPALLATAAGASRSAA